MTVNGPLMPLDLHSLPTSTDHKVDSSIPPQKANFVNDNKSTLNNSDPTALADSTSPSISLPPLTAPYPASLWATTSRVLSCLVTESLLRALYIPGRFEFELSDEQIRSRFKGPTLDGICVGLSVVLVHGSEGKDVKQIKASDVFCIVPLVGEPVLGSDGEIKLWDPMDMLPVAYGVSDGDGEVKDDPLARHTVSLLAPLLSSSRLSLSLAIDPTPLWNSLAQSLQTPAQLSKEIEAEFVSSIKMQQWNYSHPPALPSLASSAPIDWEQSIVTGHPTHPMHRTRMALGVLEGNKVLGEPGKEAERVLKGPRIRIIEMNVDDVDVSDLGAWREGMGRFVDAAFANASTATNSIIEGGGQKEKETVFIPIHEIQIPSIEKLFPHAKIYPPEYSFAARAQQSTRTVLPILPPNRISDLNFSSLGPLALKLAISVKLTSAMRTISPKSAYLGPRLCKHVLPLLTYDRKKVQVLREVASVVAKHGDDEVAKHCAAIIREAPDSLGREVRGEIVIVSTSLMDWGHEGGEGGVPGVIRAFELDDEQKRVEFLDRYILTLLEAFLPSMLINGFAFEAHPQNTLARFSSTAPYHIQGFYIRDFGGLKVHLKTLEESTGTRFEGEGKEWVKEGHSVLSEDLEDVYARMYHTIVHNHLQQLIRVLGLHYNGVGYAILRKHLQMVITRDHPLRESWLSEERTTVPGKCFVRMRIQGMFRFHLHGPFPNLIHYRGSGSASEDRVRGEESV